MTEQATIDVKLTDADVAYVRANFFTLDELVAGRPESTDLVRDRIEKGLLPRASYVLADGSEWFPADYFALLDQSGSIDALPGRFAERIRAAGGTTEDVESAWAFYLSGGYAWCLLEPTPENMMRKAQLIESIERLLDDPQPAVAEWRAELRRSVWSLDAIERPFSPDFDRSDRWETAPTRDRFIELPRRRYPEVFALPGAD
jgi:hypothetical protein